MAKSSFHKPLVVVVVCALASTSLLALGTGGANRQLAYDWPGWRGPGRNGISPETALNLDWQQRAPTRLWQVPLGTGFSSIAVQGGRLYTLAADADLEFVVCLDVADGSTLWKVPTGAGRYADAEGGDGPRCTPLLEDGRVYALGATGKLLCIDANCGAVLWKRDVLEEFGAENIHWGVSSSPLIDGENLLVNAGAKQ